MKFYTEIEFKDGTIQEFKNGMPSVSADDMNIDIINRKSIVVDGSWALEDVKKVTFEILD